MDTTPLPVRRLNYTAILPTRAKAHDAGFDLYADQDRWVVPGCPETVPTGIALALPEGTVGMVCSRSGLAAKHGIFVLNAPGIIDSGYRGEVGVVLANHTSTPYQVRAGDRIAQLVITPVLTPAVVEVDELEATDRGTGGFGSSGS